jgi:hypothetical protein
MSSGLHKAAAALAAADGVAHVAFFGLFAWRTVARDGFGRLASVVFAGLAAVGFACGAVGWMLAKYGGGRGKVGRIGLWAIAASTAIAAVLLCAASWTSE